MTLLGRSRISFCSSGALNCRRSRYQLMLQHAFYNNSVIRIHRQISNCGISMIWGSRRLTVRTAAFQVANRSSLPLGFTTFPAKLNHASPRTDRSTFSGSLLYSGAKLSGLKGSAQVGRGWSNATKPPNSLHPYGTIWSRHPRQLVITSVLTVAPSASSGHFYARNKSFWGRVCETCQLTRLALMQF